MVFETLMAAGIIVSTLIPCSIIYNCDDNTDNKKKKLTKKKTIENYEIAKENMNKCVISLIPIKKGNKIKTLVCGHTFLYDEIKIWYKMRKTCPLCRLKINTNIIYSYE